MEPNYTIMQKADMEVADLIANGGYLKEAQAEQFVKMAIKASVMLQNVQTRSIKSHTHLEPRIGFSGRVLKPGTSGHALAVGDRTKPTTGVATLGTVLVKGQINLNYEVLEDNVENGTLKQTVMSMMAEQCSADFDDLLVNGDTTSADAFLALQNGLIAGATTHTVNAGVNPIAKSYLKSAWKALPVQFRSKRANYRFFTSENAETDYRDYLANRATNLGDQSLTEDQPIRYNGRPIIPVPLMAETIGGANRTVALLCDPKNALWGIWRQIRLQTEEDIEEGVFKIVASARVGNTWIEEDGVVKIYNVSVA
jgi:hypothetical protein